MNERLCDCGCGEPALFAARHVKKSLRSGEKFSQYVEQDTGYETPCWLWRGVIETDGRYGTVYHAGRYKKAHRALWEREFGSLPAGYQLHHLCGMTQCVRPTHLMPLTNRQHVRTHQAKLTPDLVRYIRRARKPINTIARELGVSESLVQQVRSRKIWNDVE